MQESRNPVPAGQDRPGDRLAVEAAVLHENGIRILPGNDGSGHEQSGNVRLECSIRHPGGERYRIQIHAGPAKQAGIRPESHHHKHEVCRYRSLHARHLDETLLDRIGRPLECAQCHDVPDSMLASGHMDAAAPADVWLFGGAYAPETASCLVGCHWDKDPGPVWNDTSGAPRQCDACHGFPPAKTREGVPHPQVEEQELEAKIDKCRTCHQFEPATHVDGHMEFLR